MRHPGQTLTRQNILDYVWSYEADVQLTLVDVYVSYLRNKLSRSGMKDPIQTVRGLGYRLDIGDASTNFGSSFLSFTCWQRSGWYC